MTTPLLVFHRCQKHKSLIFYYKGLSHHTRQGTGCSSQMGRKCFNPTVLISCVPVYTLSLYLFLHYKEYKMCFYYHLLFYVNHEEFYLSYYFGPTFLCFIWSGYPNVHLTIRYQNNQIYCDVTNAIKYKTLYSFILMRVFF